MKKRIEEILNDIEQRWNKRQGWAWRFRNKIVYNFTKNLYNKGMPKVIPNPSIDEEDDVFSFYAKPSMQLGVPGDNQATRVDSDGQLDTRNGKFLFLLGDKLETVNKRIWTLTKGFLPEINYKIIKNELEFCFRIFQFEVVSKNDDKTPVNFIQVDIKNLSNKNKSIPLYFGYLFSLLKFKVMMVNRPRFNKNWAYEFIECDKAVRNNQLLYVSAQNPNALFSKFHNNILTPYINSFKGSALKIKRDTITLLQQHDITIDAGKSNTLIFKVPHYPIALERAELIKKIEEANINEYRERFIKFWDEILEKCTSIEVPEVKVINTSKASLIYNFMCQNFHDDSTIEQHVNRFQYNKFWLRDSSFYSKMYSVFNRPDIARRLLLHFLKYQDKSGNFCSQPGQLDGWGQTLWAFGEYVKISQDKEFAEKVYQPIMRAINYLQKVVKKDKWGVLPPKFAADNEMISGRYTGHNFWAWCGLNNAEYIADILDRKEAKLQIQSFKKEFLTSFLPVLDKIAEHFNNRIPPGLDTDIGEDWSNLLMIYPQKLLDLDDPKLKATLKDYRDKKMPEGIAMWMVFLHHYITERIAQQHLILGDQELVLRDFYSMLSHTGACHEGFEHNIKPWGDRNYLIPIRVLFLKFDYYNYPPHGWFAVAYNTLLRNMLIREEDNNLHLFSAISPEWLNGNIIVKNANTLFGKCDFELLDQDNTLNFNFKCNYERKKPDKVFFHFPFFIDKSTLKIECSQKNEFDPNKNFISIEPSSIISMKIFWKIDSKIDISYLSYNKAVDWLKSEYKKRYQQNI